jgi:hypothetical protein
MRFTLRFSRPVSSHHWRYLCTSLHFESQRTTPQFFMSSVCTTDTETLPSDTRLRITLRTIPLTACHRVATAFDSTLPITRLTTESTELRALLTECALVAPTLTLAFALISHDATM